MKESLIELHLEALLFNSALLAVSWLLGFFVKPYLTNSQSDNLKSKELFYSFFTGFICIISISALTVTGLKSIHLLSIATIIIFNVFFKCPTHSIKINFWNELFFLKKNVLLIILFLCLAQTYFGFLIYNPFNRISGSFDEDYAFYANLGYFISLYGKESFLLNPEINLLLPYHYTLAHVVSLSKQLNNLPAIVSFLLIAIPYLFGLCFIGALAILESLANGTKSKIIAVFFLVCGGIGFGGQYIFLTGTTLSILANPKISVIFLFVLISFFHIKTAHVLLYAHLIIAYYTTSVIPFFMLSLLLYAYDWDKNEFRSKPLVVRPILYHSFGTILFMTFYFISISQGSKFSNSSGVLFVFPDLSQFINAGWKFVRVFLEIALPLYIIYSSGILKRKAFVTAVSFVSITMAGSLVFVLFMNQYTDDAGQFYTNFIQALEVLIVFISLIILWSEHEKRYILLFFLVIPIIYKTSIEWRVYDSWDTGININNIEKLRSFISEEDNIMFWDVSTSKYSLINPYLNFPIKEIMLFRDYLPNELSVVEEKVNTPSISRLSAPLLWENKTLTDIDSTDVFNYLAKNKISTILISEKSNLPSYLKDLFIDSLYIPGHGKIAKIDFEKDNSF